MEARNSKQVLKTTALLVVLMVFLFAGSGAPSAKADAGNSLDNGSFETWTPPAEGLNGWTLPDGFTVTNQGAREGSNALAYSGTAEEAAVTDALTVEAGADYLFSAWVRKGAAEDVARLQVTGSGVSETLEATVSGEWVSLSGTFSSGGTTSVILRAVAKGTVLFDGITVRKINMAPTELVSNGGLENGVTGWSANTQASVDTSKAHSGSASMRVAPGGVGVATHAAVSVQPNHWYLYSGYVYRESADAGWAYIDMNDIAGEIQLRGTKLVGEWEHVSGLWNSGSRTSLSLRVVMENNWDNPNSGKAPVGNVWLDDISFMQVDVGDELLQDGTFETSGWQIPDAGKAEYSEAIRLYGDGSLYMHLADNTSGDAVAVANDGEAIEVEPNTDYFLSGYLYRTGGNRTISGYIEVLDGDETVFSVTGTRYNCTVWDISQASDPTGHWEYVSGLWNSGSHTSVKIRAVARANAATVTDSVYFDNISFRKAASSIAGENILPNGDIEDYSFNYSAAGWTLPKGAVITSEQKNSGGVSLQIVSEDTLSVQSDAAAVGKYRDYVVSGWVYKTNASDTASISVLNGTASVSLVADAPTGQWILLKKVFKTGANASVRVKLEATGAVYFDDIAVKEAEINDTNMGKIYLSDLPWESYRIEGSYQPWYDDDTTGNGMINICDIVSYEKGVRTHPGSSYDAEVVYDISGYGCTSFTAYVGRDRNGRPGQTQFKVYVDGVQKAQSPIMRWGDIHYFDVDITGASELKIVQTDGGDGYSYDGGSWGNAAINYPAGEGMVRITSHAVRGNLIDVSDTATLSGFARADAIKLYANGEYTGVTAPVTDGKWQAQVNNLPGGAVTIKAESIVNGEAMSSYEVEIDRGGDVVNVADMVWGRTTFNPPDSLRRGFSYLNDYLSVGGGAVITKNGFETHPLNAPVEQSYADLDLNLKGSGLTYFQSAVGLCDWRATTLGHVEFIVLADGQILARSGALYTGEMYYLTADIPADCETLTLRVTNVNGDYAWCSADWCEPVLAASRDALYRNPINAYNPDTQKTVVNISGANMHFEATEPFNALVLTEAELTEPVTVKVYQWLNTYLRTLQSAPMLQAQMMPGEDMAFVPLFSTLDPGEYLLVLDGPGTIGLYPSTTSVSYVDGEVQGAALGMQFMFTEQAEPYFSSVTGEVGEANYDNTASQTEKQRAETQYEGYLSDLSTFPATFTIGETDYSGFGADFNVNDQTTTTADGIETTVTKLTHISGLEFELKSAYYPAYAAFDWTIYISNNTDSNSPVVSNLSGANLVFEGADPYLLTSYGDSRQFLPDERRIAGHLEYGPTSGRSTEGAFSYYNMEYGEKGVLIGIGWSGNWKAVFDNTADRGKTHVTIGQSAFKSYLKPGETVRTPLVAFVMYDGRDKDRAGNLWRRWFIDCNMHKVAEPGEEPHLFEPVISAGTSVQYAEMTLATDANQVEAISRYEDNGIPINFWWMDAGWYYNVDDQSLPPWGWTATGTWKVDTSRFPSGMSAISDYAESVGVKTLLWFEPERVGMPVSSLKTDGSTIHPDWLLAGTLVNLGDPDAVDWIANRIADIMEKGGISLYREDFNIQPAGNWRAGDSAQGENREGITENLYVQGHLRLWDIILERLPNAIIDSCASGGNRNDLEAMRRGVPVHKTDYNYGDLTAQQGYALEMAPWMPYFGTKADSNDTTFSDKYNLRTAMVPWMVLNYNSDKPIDWDIVRDAVEEHEKIAPYIYDDFYKLTEYSRSESKWMGWEYLSRDKSDGYAIMYRRSSGPVSQTVKLKGLRPGALYRIWFEDRNDYFTARGRDLMNKGFEMSLPAAKTSDIIYIQEASQPFTPRALVANITKTTAGGQYREGIRESEDMYYVDIRLNMWLRETVLGNDEGSVEQSVQADYQDVITINGKTVTQLLAEDPDSVRMNYDVVNNILSVFVAKTSSADFRPGKENVIGLSQELATYEGVHLAADCEFTYDGETDTWAQTETPPEEVVLVTGITVTGETIVQPGDTEQLTAVLSPEHATVTGVNWSTSNTKVATVDEQGLVTAHKIGRVVITAAAKDGSGVMGSIKIMVKPMVQAPDITVVSAGFDSVEVSWNEVPDASGYEVYRAGSRLAPYVKVFTAQPGTLSFTDTGLWTGQMYYYKVCAFKTVDEETAYRRFSEVKTTTPKLSAPTITAEPVTDGSVAITWDSVPGATGYEIWRSSWENGPYKLIGSTCDTSAMDYDADAGVTYYYKVCAYRSFGYIQVYGGFSAVESARYRE